MVIIIGSNVSRRKTSIFLFLGIIMGLCFGFVLKNYRALELVKRCNFKPNILNKTPLEIINLNVEDTILNSQNNLLFVGVMTAKNFLQGRAKAVYDTWGRDVPGKIAFFSSEDSFAEGLPIVSLKGVDDRYPPQKKSFMMLYYMYEHFIDKFEWFARADDDVYINTRKLEKFLRSIDSSKPQFIGQAGKGNTEEFGLLSLEFDENFCMGGPGVILSRETLRRVAPHIPTCLKNLYSTHEDVEIGRCVQKFAGIPCTWNYEMQSILHHNSSGSHAFTGSLKSKEIHSAITLHPVKRAPLMYRLHSYMQGLRAQELRQETLSLHRDIAQMKKLLQFDDRQKLLVAGVPIFPIDKLTNDRLFLGDPDILGKSPTLNKYRRDGRRSDWGNGDADADVDADDLSSLNGMDGDAAAASATSEIQHWNFLARSIYSADHSNPKRRLESAWREGLDDVITEIMENINNFSRQRGRVIEFRELLYGYSRVNTLYGHDLILDLLMIYKKYRGKKMTVPVRRHLYVQRAFTDVFVKELNTEIPNFMWLRQSNHHRHENDTWAGESNDKLSVFSSKMKTLWMTGLGKLSDKFPLTGGGADANRADGLLDNDKDENGIADGYNFNNNNNNNIYKFDGNYLGRSRQDDQDNNNGADGSNDFYLNQKKIVFVLSLAGRFSIFQRFLKNYEEVCLKLQQNTDLIVVLFEEHNKADTPSQPIDDLNRFLDELKNLREKYPTADIHQITLKGNFSRGIALDTATRSSYIQMDNIILFIDVDITFRLASLERIRRNTIQRKQVYLPIVFSQYDPKRRSRRNTSGSPSSNFSNPYLDAMNMDFLHPVNIDYELGYFRQYGYGICSIYKSDIMHTAINGFNTDINGWGLEDVKFLEKIIKLNQKPILQLSNTAVEQSLPVIGGGGGGGNGGNGNGNDLNQNRQEQQMMRNDGSSSSSNVPMHLSIFRSVDPSLVHVFHDINCDKNLEESQYGMCLGTKANAFGSYRHIESILLNNKDIIDYVSLMNSNPNNININNNNGDKLK